jgi:hypothetical protein
MGGRKFEFRVKLAKSVVVIQSAVFLRAYITSLNLFYRMIYTLGHLSPTYWRESGIKTPVKIASHKSEKQQHAAVCIDCW